MRYGRSGGPPDGGPGPLDRVGAPDLVGRDGALADLARALARPPVVVLVEGEAGIGKSRLVAEFLAAPEGRRRRSLVARCPPYPESLALASIMDALRGWSDAVVTPLPADLPAEVDRLLPPPDPAPARGPQEDTRAARDRLFRSLLDLLTRLSVDLLVVEDAHWADPTTVEFLLFALSRQEHHPLSLLVTLRPEDVPAGSLLRRLSSRLAGGAGVRIRLDPLDAAGVTALVSSMVGGEPVSEELSSLLHAHTGGVPLVVAEVVRLLAERAELCRRDGRWTRSGTGELPVPPTVRDLVWERAQRLRPGARRTLEAVAVLGAAHPETVVAALAGMGLDEARDGLAEAVRGGLLVADDRGVGFRYQLMGRAVYDSLPAPHRRRLHLRAGRLLERDPSTAAAALADHFRQAGEAGPWCRYAAQAARLALETGDAPTAVSLLTDVLVEADPPADTRARLARTLGDAALTGGELRDGRIRAAVAALRKVLDAADTPALERGEIRARLARVLLQLREYDQARTEMERAVPELTHDPVQRAHLMLRLGNPAWRPYGEAGGDGAVPADTWPAHAHLRWVRRGVRAVAGPIDPADRLSLTGLQATALLQLGDPAGWRLAAAVPTTATVPAHRRAVALGCANLADAAMMWGRYAEARRRLEAARAIADDDGLARLHGVVLATQARLDWLTGAWSGLDERVAALADDPDLDPHVRLEAVLLRGLRDASDGAHHRAAERFRQVLDWQRERTGIDLVLAAASALGRLLLASGDAGEAERVTAGPMRLVAGKGIWVWAADLAPVRVEALVATGEIGRASDLVAAFGRGLRGRDAPAARAALATCRAVLAAATAAGTADAGDTTAAGDTATGAGDAVAARHATAAAAFGRAATAWERLPRPYEALRARERRGHHLLACGRTRDGLHLLSEVFDGLARLGARGDAMRVLRLLRRHGVEPRRPWWGGSQGYGDRLSPRELEVVRLLVGGHTNREIAHALSRSPRTVAAQLSSAMRKLGVTSRTALAVAVVEAGLVPAGPEVAGRDTGGRSRGHAGGRD